MYFPCFAGGLDRDLDLDRGHGVHTLGTELQETWTCSLCRRRSTEGVLWVYEVTGCLKHIWFSFFPSF